MDDGGCMSRYIKNAWNEQEVKNKEIHHWLEKKQPEGKWKQTIISDTNKSTWTSEGWTVCHGVRCVWKKGKARPEKQLSPSKHICISHNSVYIQKFSLSWNKSSTLREINLINHCIWYASNIISQILEATFIQDWHPPGFIPSARRLAKEASPVWSLTCLYISSFHKNNGFAFLLTYLCAFKKQREKAKFLLFISQLGNCCAISQCHSHLQIFFWGL